MYFLFKFVELAFIEFCIFEILLFLNDFSIQYPFISGCFLACGIFGFTVKCR